MTRRIQLLFLLIFISVFAFAQNKPIVASDLMKIATTNQYKFRLMAPER
jgi:hypothetical protein